MTGTPPILSSHNEGIQANTVQAEVLAVGHGVQAIKYSAAGDAEALARAIEQLREAIAGLGLQASAREILEADVRGLADTVRTGRPDEREAQTYLKGIADKLKMVGVVLSEVVGLAEPVTKIANLLRVPLTFLTGG